MWQWFPEPDLISVQSFLTKSFICFSPSSAEVIKQSAFLSGMTTPFTMFNSEQLSSSSAFSKQKGSVMTSSTLLTSFCTSDSSLFSLWDPASLREPTLSLSPILHDSLVAVVMAALSWLVRNHCTRASGFCVLLIMPPLLLLSIDSVLAGLCLQLVLLSCICFVTHL